MKWTCPQCSITMPVEASDYPIRCVCGLTDDGKTPSVVSRINRFARHAIQHLAAGAPTCSQEEIDARLAVCRPCAFFTGEICRKCGCNVNGGKFLNKLGWADQSCPANKWGPVEVLMPLTGSPRSGWWEIRGQVVVDELQTLGHTGRLVSAGPATPEALQQLLLAHSPRVMLNRAMYYPPEVIEAAAKRHKDVQFLTVNHSSQSHLLHAPHWLDHQRRHLELSSQLPNVWFGLVDERLPFARHKRVVWVPNLLPVIASSKAKSGDYVSLVGRWDWAKNFPNQMAACEGLDVLAVMKTTRAGDIETMAATYGAKVKSLPWTDRWRLHIDRLAELVSVGLQCSFTESFNYVALEHLALGIPVIGSPAIRYLPREWQANPDDPSDIRARLLHVMSQGDVSDACQAIADKVRRRNAGAFSELVGRLV